jgi:hypothetical protein
MSSQFYSSPITSEAFYIHFLFVDLLYKGYFNWLRTLNYKSQATGLGRLADVRVDIDLMIHIN